MRTRQPRSLVACQPQALAIVAGRPFVPHLLGTHLLESLGCAPAVVGVPQLDELAGGGLIQRESLGLAVWTARSTLVGPLVPVQTEPVQRVEDLALAVGHVATAIGVFDAQHELTTTLPRQRGVEQRHVGGPDMRIAGRRGCDTDADGHQ